MARRYSPGASKDVEREMRKFKRGTLKSGKGGKGGKVKSRRHVRGAPGRQARPLATRRPSVEDGALERRQESRAHEEAPQRVILKPGA